MKTFTPCQGKNACRDNGSVCLTCGRSLEEITWLRDVMDQLVTIAIEFGYSNIDDYAGYVARKLKKSIEYRQQQQEPENHVRSD